MIPAGYISIQQLAAYYGPDMPLVREFIQFGLVETSVQGNEECLPAEKAESLGRLLRLHRELGVNKEGIEVIEAMRNRIIALNREVERLRQQMQRQEEELLLRYWHEPLRLGLLSDLDELQAGFPENS